MQSVNGGAESEPEQPVRTARAHPPPSMGRLGSEAWKMETASSSPGQGGGNSTPNRQLRPKED